MFLTFCLSHSCSLFHFLSISHSFYITLFVRANLFSRAALYATNQLKENRWRSKKRLTSSERDRTTHIRSRRRRATAAPPPARTMTPRPGKARPPGVMMRQSGVALMRGRRQQLYYLILQWHSVSLFCMFTDGWTDKQTWRFIRRQK